MTGIEAKFSLVCRIGTLHCALPLEHVIETMRPLPLEPLGELALSSGGTAIVRGAPVPVLIVNRWFDRQEAPPRRFVIARVRERRIGLAVDAVVGVHVLDSHMLKRQPTLLGEAPADIADAIDTDLRALLETARIVPPGVVASVEAGAAAS